MFTGFNAFVPFVLSISAFLLFRQEKKRGGRMEKEGRKKVVMSVKT